MLVEEESLRIEDGPRKPDHVASTIVRYLDGPGIWISTIRHSPSDKKQGETRLFPAEGNVVYDAEGRVGFSGSLTTLAELPAFHNTVVPPGSLKGNHNRAIGEAIAILLR